MTCTSKFNKAASRRFNPVHVHFNAAIRRGDLGSPEKLIYYATYQLLS